MKKNVIIWMVAALALVAVLSGLPMKMVRNARVKSQLREVRSMAAQMDMLNEDGRLRLDERLCSGPQGVL